MEKGSTKIIAWVGLALGVLALFLAVYTRWIEPSLLIATVKTPEQLEAEEKTPEQLEAEAKEEKWALANKVAKERADWTYEDYAALVREEALKSYREHTTLDEYIPTTDAELASFQMTEAYVTREYESENKERNNGADLVVIFQWLKEGQEEPYYYHFRYTMDEDAASTYRLSYYWGIENAGEFMDYWIENQTFLKQSGAGAVTYSSHLDYYKEDCMVCYTAEEFESFYKKS